jgi:hypothetical protein
MPSTFPDEFMSVPEKEMTGVDPPELTIGAVAVTDVTEPPEAAIVCQEVPFHW